jgi:2-oxoglutarate ferredoxin oxidoreductase subunit delta
MAEPVTKELKINKVWCKGCGICVAFCPKNALEMVDGKVQLKKDGECILCGLCELRCPDYAIYIDENEEEAAQWVK